MKRLFILFLAVNLFSSNVVAQDEEMAEEATEEVGITGRAFKQLEGDKCVMRVKNEADYKISAQVEVVQFDSNNKRLKSTPFSLSLAAGQSQERDFKAHPKSSKCQFSLKKTKDYKPKRKKKDIEAEIMKKKKELEALTAEIQALEALFAETRY